MKILLAIGVVAVFLSYSTEASASLPEPVLKPGELETQPEELPAPEGLDLDEDSYPVTDGSTSAEPLGVWVAARLFERNVVWGRNFRDYERRLLPVSSEGKNIDGRLFFVPTPGENGWRLIKADPQKGRIDQIYNGIDNEFYDGIKHHGTHGAYKKLIKGEADLIYECRRPSPDEVKLIEEHGVELEITPIALDAFVFLRHKDNPVTDLTSEQVRDIYTRVEDGDSGRIDNWEQVGGPDARINAYTRNPNSGSQETLKTLVMKDREIIPGRDMRTLTMMGPFDRIYRDQEGVGFTFFYYQRHMAPLSVKTGMWGDTESETDDSETESPVKMFAIDGVQPTRETIADGSYPWVTEVYAVTRSDLDPEHPAALLRDWLLTEEGQGVIAETGYVPLQNAPVPVK